MTSQLRLGLEAPKAARSGALRHHHVRSHQTVEEAQAGEARAARGDRRVLDVFRPGQRLTPSQVHGLLCDETGPRAPLLTSIRRALTNLTTAGKLVHHPEDRREGPRGARESTWGLPA